MTDKSTKAPDLESLRTVTDDEITTERKVPRRSFLGATGALLAGAAGMVSGIRASGLHNSPQDDPDKKPADPNKRSDDPQKRSDDPQKRSDDPQKRSDDPNKRADDPQKRSDDPNKRADDPQKRSDDPHGAMK